MYRTLNDIERRYVIVPAGEGVSLADIQNVPPGAPEDVLPGAGISFADLVRTINPTPDPAVWREANGLPSQFAERPRREPNVVEDVARSTWRGIANEGVAELVGLPDTLSTWGAKGIDAASKFVADRLGMEYERPDAAKMREDWPTFVRVAQTVRNFIPTAEGTGKFLKEYVPGADYDPRTTWGEYGKTVGSFAPGAMLGPGSTVAKITRFAVAPGLASEAAGQAAQGTEWEPWARGGAALGTLGGAAWLSRRPRQNVDAPQASLYPYETVPQRPYAWDYPQPAKATNSGQLLETIDKDAIVAKHVAGRQTVGGPDVPMSEAALYQAARELTGNPVRFVHESKLPKDVVAAYDKHVPEILVWNRLTPAARYEAIAHELGHHAINVNPAILDDIARSAAAQAELGPLYHWGYKGNYTPPLKVPQDYQYSDAHALEELVAELYRIAFTNPNSSKRLAPTASELLRKSHNKNALLNPTIQINSLPAAIGLGALAYPPQEPDER